MTEKTTITTVPLAQCRLSPLNPRGAVTEAEITDLARSIRTVGLIQSLAGWEPEPGQTQIVAGGRRLRAIEQIVCEDGLDPEKYTLPVMLAASEDEARLWATSENVARAPLHPADEITLDVAQAYSIAADPARQAAPHCRDGRSAR